MKARGREWVVLLESEEDLLVLRPLGGTEDEVTGVFLPLETVESATFDLPDPTRTGFSWLLHGKRLCCYTKSLIFVGRAEPRGDDR